MLETYLLIQLAEFAKHGSLSEASRQLNISQPAVSRSMKKLEEILGVTMFERTKNHISINETGRLAAEFAEQILKQQQDMLDKIRAFDRSLHTISIGGCAPIPLNEMMYLIQKYFPDMSISTELSTDSKLLQDLKNGFLQLAILHEPFDEKDVYMQKCGSERLYISLSQEHPLADSKGIYLEQLNGRHVLLYSKIGFWYDLCMEKIPQAKFILQHERNAFNELVDVSTLPSFSTDYFIKRGYAPKNRINVPILDDEADVTYYCACMQKSKSRFKAIFDALQNQNDWIINPDMLML